MQSVKHYLPAGSSRIFLPGSQDLHMHNLYYACIDNSINTIQYIQFIAHVQSDISDPGHMGPDTTGLPVSQNYQNLRYLVHLYMISHHFDDSHVECGQLFMQRISEVSCLKVPVREACPYLR